jgi:hypothetical protein
VNVELGVGNREAFRVGKEGDAAAAAAAIEEKREREERLRGGKREKKRRERRGKDSRGRRGWASGSYLNKSSLSSNLKSQRHGKIN